MKLNLISLFMLLSLCSVAQREIKFHFNTRNAKESRKFDYYTKLNYYKNMDSLFVFKGMANFERDNGIKYYSYSAGINYKYIDSEYYKDTEKDINYFSLSFTYPINGYLKAGYNYLSSSKQRHLLNVNINWKFVKLDVSFLNNIEKLKLNINPESKINKHSYIGFDVGLIYISGKLKWNSGFTIRYKIF